MPEQIDASYGVVPQSSFEAQFMTKQMLVDSGVEYFADGFRERLGEENAHSKAAIEGYLSLLMRGGKRWRGVLSVVGYELYDGQDTEVIARASGAIEGLHAFMLVLDDCADQDETRRGGPALHTYVTRYLEQQGARGDLAAAGVSIATTIAFMAQYWSKEIVEDLPVPHQRSTLARRLMHRELLTTGIGQLLDELGSHVPLEEADIIRSARYKTARYTFLLPLQVGAALGGALPEELSAFEPYADNVGLAFQFRDDIVGLFGADTGKSADKDITGNKQTLLMTKTLQRATSAEREVLESALHSKSLRKGELQRCREIIQNTGALATIEALIDTYTEQALDALTTVPGHWPPQQVEFLRTLALKGAKRRA